MAGRPTEDIQNIPRCIVLTLATCGIYDGYWQHTKMLSAHDIMSVAAPDQKNDGLIAILLSLFGLAMLADAIQPSRINSYFGDVSL